MTRSALVLSVSQLLLAATVAAQQTGTISGHVIDRESLKPIPSVVVRIRGFELRALTNADGVFRIDEVPSGKRLLVVEHIAYGEHTDTVVVGVDNDVRLEVRLSSQAIQLSPLVVEALTELERRRVTSGHRMHEIVRPEISAAARRGLDLGTLLRDQMLGIRVSPAGRMGGAYCVEYRWSGGARPTCRELAVFVDGVRISAPSSLYSMMPLETIERLEVLSPGEAGARYGLAGGWGVLLIETRQGPRAERTVYNTRFISGFGWSEETRPYQWARVLGSAIAGNVIGLGLGLIVADQCLQVTDHGTPALRTKCGAMTTMGSGFLGLGLPSVAGSVAAHWTGATDRSRGRMLPSALLGTLTVASGYLLYVQGESRGSDVSRTAGVLVLTVGTPLVATFADRVFRGLR